MTINTIPALKPIRKNQFGYWQARHLLNRAGFGGTPEQVRALADRGLVKAVRHLVFFDDAPPMPVKSDTFDGDIFRPFSPEQRRAYRKAQQTQDEEFLQKYRKVRQDRRKHDRRQIREMRRWWLKRLIETDRPLQEKMTLFLHGHFATGYRTIQNSYHMFLQNQMFRANATGSFARLCLGIIRDPAMIAYLDNDDSRRQKPNENLARELMELFTLGEGNAYTENDIKEGARALTGYTFAGNNFVFRENWHDPGRKRILGKSGTFDGNDFARIILGRPECSQFICYKLYKFFVNDLPNGPGPEAQRFILALAELMRDENYALGPVLETLFKSAHFHDEINVGAQIKSPVQLLVGAVRSLGTPLPDPNLIIAALDMMGQNLFQPPSVKGWDGGRAWINTSTLFVRHNLLIHLLTGRRLAGFSPSGARSRYDALKLLASVPKADGRYDVPVVAQYLLRMAFGKEASTERARTLVDYANEKGGRITNEIVIGMLSLITAMPEFQLT